MAKSPLDDDPFASTAPTARIDHLYRMRRATHRAITLYGEALWAKEQHYAGKLTAPASIENLPAPQQPEEIAASEAARLADAHLYGLDEAATAAAITCGASLVEYTSADTAPPFRRGWSYVDGPPTEAGLLRWATGIGYDNVGVPLIACHWAWPKRPHVPLLTTSSAVDPVPLDYFVRDTTAPLDLDSASSGPLTDLGRTFSAGTRSRALTLPRHLETTATVHKRVQHTAKRPEQKHHNRFQLHLYRNSEVQSRSIRL